jgi:hypothetical protein
MTQKSILNNDEKNDDENDFVMLTKEASLLSKDRFFTSFRMTKRTFRMTKEIIQKYDVLAMSFLSFQIFRFQRQLIATEQ